MSSTTQYDIIVCRDGKGGKTLATELGHNGIKTALLERSALRDAVLSHPKMVEGFNNLPMNLV